MTTFIFQYTDAGSVPILEKRTNSGSFGVGGTVHYGRPLLRTQNHQEPEPQKGLAPSLQEAALPHKFM